MSSLADLRCGQSAVLESLDVAEDLGRRLMELGFFPGGDIVVAGCAPGGDPRVYRVDGSEVALRVETARSLMVQTNSIRTAGTEPTSRR
ncbi:MAG TPA: FeoA family protein [Bryobacteraceae bacterium]|nr:FeoA family protein [Bryobacteraceae bacterium]